MSMTPREIVHELNRHIIGQDDAKRAVAIALRNRWRRMQLPVELRAEVTPKNILMIGLPVSARPKSPVVWPSWPTHHSSRSKPPSSLKWATWAATSSRSSVTWPTPR